MSGLLKRRLEEQAPVLAPGVYDALSAWLVETAGFEAAYVSGASVAYTQLGRPDLAFVSFDHLADVVRRIRERVSIPVIVDADTGWGNALNVQRTVRLLESAGASAIQLEDQQFPKRCGHLSGKQVIPAEEMAGKLKAACDARHSEGTLIIARTDVRAEFGLHAALDRAELYLEAGADILFVEALESRSELECCASRLAARAPLLANMVEGGRTPLLPLDELARFGFRIVISPGALARLFCSAAMAFLEDLRASGSTSGWQDRMLNLHQLNALLGTPEMIQAGDLYAGDCPKT